MPSPRKLCLQPLLVWKRAPVLVPAERNSAAVSKFKPGRALVLLVLASALTVSSSGSLFAQSSSTGQSPSGEPEGVTSGGYVIHSSIDFGGRYNNVTGSGDMYDTL